MALPKAKCRNETIDGRSHGLALLPQDTEIPRGCHRKLRATCCEYLKSKKLATHTIERPIITNALQNLAQNDVRQSKAPSIDFSIQPPRFGILHTAEIVNPNCCINYDHVGYSERPSRDTVRSPSHRIFPRNRRIRACACV